MASVPQNSILLIDDHRMFSESLRIMMLKHLPEIQNIDLAYSSTQAGLMLNRSTYALALLDIHLPDKEGDSQSAGLHLCSLIRKKYPQCKVLILSAYNEHYFIQQARLLGACGYLFKDLPVNTLILGIRRVLSGGSYFDLAQDHSLGQCEIEEQISYLHPRVIEMLLVFLHRQGPSNLELGSAMGLKEKTIRNYMSQAYDQLDMHNRSKMLLWLQSHEMYLRNALEKKTNHF